MVVSFESVSTWRQPVPVTTSDARRRVVGEVAAAVAGRSAGRLRVAVDGLTGAGKTTFGHELAAALRALGRPTARASLDDFKHPWRHAREHGYDRLSGRGYYANAYDFESARRLLLEPAGSHASGIVALCGHDPLTGIDHRDVLVHLPSDAVLVVDTVFAFRPQYDDCWDYRIWLEVTPEIALQRGIARDAEREGAVEAERLHRERYQAAEAVYLSEVQARPRADVVIDNSVLNAPVLRRPRV